MKSLVLSKSDLREHEIKKGDTLSQLQELVGGYIEIPYLSRELCAAGIDIVINDEGKLLDGFEKELAIVDKATEQLIDIVYGNCVFVSHDEDGNTTGLTEDQINLVTDALSISLATFADGSVTRVLFV
jgi:hypothetical protein